MDLDSRKESIGDGTTPHDTQLTTNQPTLLIYLGSRKESIGESTTPHDTQLTTNYTMDEVKKESTIEASMPEYIVVIR